MLTPLDVKKLIEELELNEENIESQDNFLSKRLVGKIISNIYVDCVENPELLTFETIEGNFISFETEGDCCSHCWFADLFNIPALLNNPIQGSNKIDLEKYDYNTEDGRCTEDIDIVYGFRIYSKKGTAVLSFRNSSNGYYGGQIAEAQEHTTNYCLTSLTNWMSSF